MIGQSLKILELALFFLKILFIEVQGFVQFIPKFCRERMEVLFSLCGQGEEIGITNGPDELCHGTCGTEDIPVNGVSHEKGDTACNKQTDIKPVHAEPDGDKTAEQQRCR